MEASLKIARLQERASQRKDVLDLVRMTGDGAKDIALAVLNNPVFTLIAANVAIEALQLVRVKNGQYGWKVPAGAPYGTPHQYTQLDQPLLSQAHATTLETVINTGAALSSISAGLATILAIKAGK